jgi:apolipoprotein N-acyltransferase
MQGTRSSPSASARVLGPILRGALSGALLTLALPWADISALGWIAVVPLLYSLSGRSGRWETFLAGYSAGFVFFAGTCYWITYSMYNYGGLPLVLAVAVLLVFVSVFAFHTAAFALLLRVCVDRWPVWGLLLAAPIWVAVELVQGHLIFGGFPWMLAGYALAPFDGLLQIVTWSGVYGLSFVLVGVNALLAVALRKRDWKIATAGVAIALGASLFPAPPEAGGAIPPQDRLGVRIVQTRIPIDYEWGGDAEQALLDELTALTVAGGPGPSLVVWPESPGPFYLSLDPGFRSRIASVAGRLDASVLVGYIDLRDGMPTNSAGLVSPTGAQVSRYDKIHLVPFGEYVPLRKVLFFAESMVRNVGDFSPGRDLTISQLDGHRFATNICYEDVFPDLIRRFTQMGAQVIVNITNDDWFGDSSAPYQHLRMAVVRAVENRRYLVRAANTGISALIDPYGRVLAETSIGERTVLDDDVGYRSDLTFYVRFGDVFALTASLVALVSLLVAFSARNAR